MSKKIDNIKEFSYKLVAKQLAINEEIAKKMIMAGELFLEHDRSYKVINSEKYLINTVFWHKKNDFKVSRGEHKLKKAIMEFKIITKDTICIDVGSSTGGFTQVLLESGAKQIYAVDAGENQLNYGLRQNSKIVTMEKYNFRYARIDDFPKIINIITMDVSHISVLKLLHNVSLIANNNTDIIILIKPQFEADYKDVKNGLIRDKNIHFNVILNIIRKAAIEYGLYLIGLTYSPILGKTKANIEYLAYFKKDEEKKENISQIITTIIKNAWKELYNE